MPMNKIEQLEIPLADKRKIISRHKTRPPALREHQRRGMKLSTPQLVWGMKKQPQWVAFMRFSAAVEGK